jgi:hypothetical protein
MVRQGVRYSCVFEFRIQGIGRSVDVTIFRLSSFLCPVSMRTLRIAQFDNDLREGCAGGRMLRRKLQATVSALLLQHEHVPFA